MATKSIHKHILKIDERLSKRFVTGIQLKHFLARLLKAELLLLLLDIVDLDENPDNSLVLAKLSDEVVKSAGKKGGGFGGKSYQG